MLEDKFIAALQLLFLSKHQTKWATIDSDHVFTFFDV